MTNELADLVLKNGAVYTVDAQWSWAQAVAVTGGRLAYVGADTGVERYIGPGTDVLDLDGKMVLPGFFDCHAHPSEAVSLALSANLHNLQSLEEYQQTITQYAQANPDAPVIRGAGWSNTLFPESGPGKEILDALVPDRPACLISEDGHSYWVNSLALAAAGIDKHTHAPEGGVIERDPLTGEPNGTLRESAMELVNELIPDYTADEWRQGLLAYQNMAAACGVTSAMESMADRALGAYKGLAADDLLTVRFRGSLLIDPGASPDDIAALVEERARNTHPLFQTDSAKVFVDGVVEGETAYLLEPYAHRPDYRGELLWDPQHLNTMCAALDKAGFQIHVHAIGDAATRITLDALEFAQQANGVRDSRHLITHVQLVHPDDVPRFAQLGVVGVPQPFWFSINPYYWNLELPYLGKERAAAEYPMQSFFDAGVVIASGSDFPVTLPFDPLTGIQTGITRSQPGQTTDPGARLKEGEFGVLGPSERAGLADMIASFTANGAYALFVDDEAGSLEVGKSADLVVLERNLFEIPVTDIHSTPVLLTMFAGRVVHRGRF